jgi:uncharacterized protein (TIGR00159 family)
MFSEALNHINNGTNTAGVVFSKVGEIISVFQFKDIFDIAVVAIITYAVLMLFIKTKSMPIILGIFAMILVYGMALFFNLPLTQIIFKYFFGAFLIVMLIVFQKELRRFFEMIGVLGIRRRFLVSSEDALKTILRTVWSFAQARTGALIVFSGKTPIERYIDGGFFLNGKISEPILLSIFDKHSPGHDGAVIIEENRIKRFGVHLPLAEKIESVKKFGTRHRAALGISEKTDAFCLVVSEERGDVSLAHNGKIKMISSSEELEKETRKFFEKINPKQKFDLKIWLKKNILPIILSLGIAVVFWLAINNKYD